MKTSIIRNHILFTRILCSCLVLNIFFTSVDTKNFAPHLNPVKEFNSDFGQLAEHTQDNHNQDILTKRDEQSNDHQNFWAEEIEEDEEEKKLRFTARVNNSGYTPVTFPLASDEMQPWVGDAAITSEPIYILYHSLKIPS